MPPDATDLLDPPAVTPDAPEPEPDLRMAQGRLQPEVEAAPEDDATPSYRAWLVPEGIATDDGRYMMPGSLSPRLERLPLMASDENVPAHLGATFVGNLIDVGRLADASEVSWVTFVVDFDDDDDATEWRRMVDNNRIRGVSADLIVQQARFKATDPETGDPVILDYFTEQPAEDQSWPDEAVWFVLDEGLVGGATLVPMPAFRDARVEPIAASAALSALPPDWFQLPEFPQPQRAARDQYGRLRGHGAKWGTCLVGHAGPCVIPPESRTDYALARRLEGLVPIYWQPNGDAYSHAPRDQAWWDAISWYEGQCKVVGLAAVGEDSHGIALAGYCGPELEGRHLSGDWRPYPGGYELVGWSIVNKPGFPVPEAIAAAVAGGRAITGSAEPDCDCEGEAIAAAAQGPQTAPGEPAEAEGVLVPVESLERLTASLEGLVSQLSLGLTKAQLEWDRHLATQRVEQLTADLG